MSIEAAPRPSSVERIKHLEAERPKSLDQLINAIPATDQDHIKELIEHYAASRQFIDVMPDILALTRTGVEEQNTSSLRQAWLFFYLLAADHPDLYLEIGEHAGEFEVRKALFTAEPQYQQGYAVWLAERNLSNKPGLDADSDETWESDDQAGE